MKVYLASPFFNEEENNVYHNVIDILRGQENIDLFVPKEHTIPNAWDLCNRVWAENVFAVDLLALQKADVVVVLNFGMYSDSGTAWECGYAYALGKKVVNVCVGYDKAFSLMMLNGTNCVVSLADLSLWTLEEMLEGEINCASEYEQK
jgi:nucleoside 2-deoxyribosyltransferase